MPYYNQRIIGVKPRSIMVFDEGVERIYYSLEDVPKINPNSTVMYEYDSIDILASMDVSLFSPLDPDSNKLPSPNDILNSALDSLSKEDRTVKVKPEVMEAYEEIRNRHGASLDKLGEE